MLTVTLGAAIVGVVTAPASASSGGPDAFGYCFLDSNEANGPPLGFKDLQCAEGPTITLADDQVSGPIPIGFDFVFYGVTYSNVFVSSNGFVTFDPLAPSGCCEGQQIPSSSGPTNLIAAYWANLNPGGTTPLCGSDPTITWVNFRHIGLAGHREFDIQFNRVPHSGTGVPVTFQVELFEGSNRLRVSYPDAPSDGTVHSAGIENAAGDTGLQYMLGSFSLSQISVEYVPPGDSDGDDLSDCAELVTIHTNPGDPDTDNDGFGDGIEVNGGSCLGIAVPGGADPLNWLSNPLVQNLIPINGGIAPPILPVICP
jgi:hypothetical protein